MDIRKVKKLIELLQGSGISEIELHEGEESIRISSHHNVAVQQTAPIVQQLQHPATTSVASSGVSEPPVEDGHVIKSPMVGTFYSSSTPGKPDFVEVGQIVNKGDVLCIIEAMKIMNQIEADVAGSISKIFVGNGELVEYGQPLFLITVT